MHLKVWIWTFFICSACIERCDGSWNGGTTETNAIEHDLDDNKPDLDNEPPPPTTTTPTTTTPTTTTPTTTTPTTTTPTTTTPTTTTPTTTTPTTTTPTTTTPTTTTPTTTTPTTTTPTTTTPTTTTPTTTTPTTTTPTTTTPTTTTPTTTTPTTTTPTTTTINFTTPRPPKDCDIEVDLECLEPKEHLWKLPATKEFLIFQIRLRNALICDRQAKLFLLQIPQKPEKDVETKCVFDTSNGSERDQCPIEELNTLFGFWRDWNELCVVVMPDLQNVTFTTCERRVDCCGAGTRCGPAGFVRKSYLIYCDRYYPYLHPFIAYRTPDVIYSDLLIQGDVDENDIPSYDLQHDSSTHLGKFYLRHDLLPQGCNCLKRGCNKFKYGLK